MTISGITIKDNVMIALNVTSLTPNHDMNNHNILIAKPIHIKKNAWIKVNVTIPSITIGENSVVRACSIVTKNGNNNTIVV